MSSKSKNKGSSWERDISNHLSKLYNASFIRSPGSGAYTGGSNSKRKEYLHEGQIRAFKGDIVPPFEWNRFNCEAKNYADFPFHQLTQGCCKQLDTWLAQLKDASDNFDLDILLFKITRKGKYVAVSDMYDWNLLCNHFVYNSEKYGIWIVFDYDTFWELNKDNVEKISVEK